MSEFLRREIGGIENLVAFYNIWSDNKSVPAAFEIISYEAMKKDPKSVLLQCIDFYDWPKKDDSLIDNIVSKGSFKSMQKLEKRNELKSIRLSPITDKDPESLKTRKGKVGGYTEYLSDEDQKFISDYLAEHLSDDFAEYKY